MAHDVITKPEFSEGPLPRMTFEEFLVWAEEDTRAEWIDGEVILMSPVSLPHQHLNRFLLLLLGFFVERFQLGELLDQTFLMRLNARPSGREPDIIFVASEHADRITRTHLNGPGDVVIEIVSEESIERDRVTKRAEYETAGVREYWLIDPLVPEAIFYRLNARGQFEVVPVGSEGIFRSEVLPGFWLNVNWFWQEPKPLFEAMRALNLM